MNTKILVCCHKDDICVKSEPYLPIQVGKAISSVNLGILGDNTGENISKKNENYCELTGIFWAWKNLKDVEVIGLCHYRRYFDFHHQCRFFFPYDNFQTRIFNRLDFSIPQDIQKKINKGEVITPRRWSFGMPLGTYYCVKHYSIDLYTLEKIIESNCSLNYIEAFRYIMYGNNKLIPFNMFIMPWAIFDKYCHWLFNILFLFEEKVDIREYDDYQKRIFGFVSERLFNVFLLAEKIHIHKYPIMCITDTPRKGRLIQILSLFMKELSFFFQKVLYYWGAKYEKLSV